MKKILIDFILINNDDKNTSKFLFWSCVLNSAVDVDNVGFNFMNKDNDYKIDCFPYKILVNYSEFTNIPSDIYDIERPKYFLQTNGDNGPSPYYNSCAYCHTYYRDADKFIKSFREYIKSQKYSEFKMNLLLNSIIKIINDIIGINIFNMESLPGALSIYEKLPSFKVFSNIKKETGVDRYISVICTDKTDISDSLIEIEANDKNKIISKNVYKYESGKKYIFDDSLEQFFGVSISIYNNNGNSYELIYKDTINFVRNVNFNMSVSSNTKLVNTRYLSNRNTEEINTHVNIKNDIKSNLSDSWVEYEYNFRQFIYGKDKNFLKSYFFKNDNKGREEFLEWFRNSIKAAEKICIMDPFFDENSINDLNSCLNTDIDITIITTNPNDNKRDKHISDDEFKKMLKFYFPKIKLLYIKRSKMHDRYLIISNKNEDDIFYNLSNSWNGTVNNYSLLIQEVPYKLALQISEEINGLINNYKEEFLQDKELEDKELEDKELEDKELEDKENQELNNSMDNQYIIDCMLKICNYEYKKGGDNGITIYEKLNKLDKTKLEDIARLVITKMLKIQKKKSIKEKHFINVKSIDVYNSDIQETIDLIEHRIDYMEPVFMYFDFCLYRLSQVIFSIIPLRFKDLLIKIENEICSVTDNKNINFKYNISEILVSYYFYDILLFRNNEKLLNEFKEKVREWNFANVFIAEIEFRDILNNNYSINTNNITINVDDIINIVENSHLGEYKYILFISFIKRMYGRKQINNNMEKIYKYIQKSDIKYIILFAYKMYLEDYNSCIEDFLEYIEYLNKNCSKDLVEKIENILIIKSFSIDNKIQNAIIDLIVKEEDKNLYFHIIQDNDKHFNRYIYYNLASKISNILYKRLDNEKYKTLIYKLDRDKNLIFNIRKYKNVSIYLYFINIILWCLYFSREDNNYDINKILDYFEWYIPIVIDSYSIFENNIDLSVLDFYLLLINKNNNSEDKIIQLAEQIHNNIQSKILVLSSLNKQKNEYIKLYKDYINSDLSMDNRVIILYMYVYLSMQVPYISDDNIIKLVIDLLKFIIEKYINHFISDIKDIFNKGLIFAECPNKKNKEIYINSMENKFLPAFILSLE